MPVTTRSATARIWAERKAESDAEAARLDAELVARGPVSFGGPRPPHVPHVYLDYGMSRNSIPIEQRQQLSESANAVLRCFDNTPGYENTTGGPPLAMVGSGEDADEDSNEPKEEYDETETKEYILKAWEQLPQTYCSTPQPSRLIKLEAEDSPDPVNKDSPLWLGPSLKAERIKAIETQSVDRPASIKMEPIPVWPELSNTAEPIKPFEVQSVNSPRSIKMEDIPVWPEAPSGEASATPEPETKKQRSL